MPSQNEEIQRWATGGAGEGDPALPSSDIRDYVEQDIASMGSFHTDTATLPATASERPNGTFFDVSDLIRYLDGGALLFRDENGEFIPNPIVNIVRIYDEDDDLYYYRVYVDDQS